MQSALSNVAYQRDSCGGNNDTAWHLQETGQGLQLLVASG